MAEAGAAQARVDALVHLGADAGVGHREQASALQPAERGAILDGEVVDRDVVGLHGEDAGEVRLELGQRLRRHAEHEVDRERAEAGGAGVGDGALGLAAAVACGRATPGAWD